MASSNRTCGRAASIAIGAVLLLSLACGGGSGGGAGGGTIGDASRYSLELSTASIAMSADRNGPMPVKTLTAKFVGDGLVVGYPPGVSAAGWLTATIGTPVGGSATISLRATTSSLSPGDYRTTVRIVTGKADGSAIVYKDVDVEYVVHAGLQAPSTSLVFSSPEGVAPTAKTVALSSDVFPRSWALSVEPFGTAPSDWVVLPATSGTLTSGTVDVEVGAAARPPGTYRATLVVKDGAGVNRARIDLSYQVTAAFTLAGALTTRVTEAATLASLDLPLALTTKLDAASGAGRTWQATASADWLAVVPPSGDLAADAQLAVRLDPAKLWALANGSYSATVTVATQGGGSSSVPVSLTLALAPALSAPASVPWTVGVASTTADLARPATVSTNLGDAFAGHGAWHAATAAGWLKVTASSADEGGRLTLAVDTAALAGLANGAQAATVTLTADDARVAKATLQANVQIALPDVAYVAPYSTWAGRAPTLILRGSGFGTSGTVPVLFGSDQATGTVVSDTEIHVTAPTQPSAGRVPVSIANALGVARTTSELVVLADPAYASYQKSIASTPGRMTLDPERRAVLLSGRSTGEVRRFTFSGGAWAEDVFTAPNATGAYLTVDGKDLLVTSGTMYTDNVVLRLDPATFAVRGNAGFSSYPDIYDLAAGFNDGRVLVLDSDQWVSTVWYPALTRGLYVDAWSPVMLLTRDRSRMIVQGLGAGSTLSSYDVADAAAVKRSIAAAVGAQCQWSVSGDGGRLVVKDAVYDRAFGFLGSVAQPDRSPAAVAVAPDGSTLYTLSRNQADTAWVVRRTAISGTGPYTADATPLAIGIGGTESPIAMAVSEDGSALFLLTYAPTGSTGTIFRAVPLP